MAETAELRQPCITPGPDPLLATPQARSRRITWRRLALGVALAGVLAGTYLPVRYLRPATARADIQLFTVARRSFPVVVQQKGELKAANQIDVRCELQGRATILKIVDEGKSVRKGDILVELASDEIEEQVREAESKEIMARAAYEAAEKELQILKDKNLSELSKARVKHSLAVQASSKYSEGDAVQEQQEKKLAVDEAAYNLKRAEDSLKDTRDLFKQGFVARLDVEAQEATVYQNRIKLQNAELALKVLEKFTIPMEVQQKQSDLDEALNEVKWKEKEAEATEAKAGMEAEAKQSDYKLAKDKLARMLDQKSKTRIVAADDGMVVYHNEEWWNENQIKAGAQVREQQILIQLPDTSSMKVIIRVHEAKAEKLEPGLPAIIQVDGLAGRQFSGRVSKVAMLADSKNSWLNPNIKEYETEVLLDKTSTELKPGLTAHVQLKLADLTDVLAVPAQSVFGKGRRYFVFVQNGGQTRPVEVKMGLASTEFVEILEGLQAGDQVRLNVSDEDRLLLPDDNIESEDDTWSQTSAAETQPASAPAAEAGSATTQPASAPEGS